jgi:hypothetical protein
MHFLVQAARPILLPLALVACSSTSASSGATGSTSTSTVGSGGAASSTGTGGAVVPPAPCANLAEIGTWELVSPVAGATVLTIVVDPLDHTTAYSTVDKDGLYRSSDCGHSWTKVSTGRNSDVLASGSQWVLRIDPKDSQVMYTSPLYGSQVRLYKSTNGGVDWDSLFAQGGAIDQAIDTAPFVEEMNIDTADDHHLVVSFHENCLPPHNPVCFVESTNAGLDWTFFDGPTSLTSWVEDSGPAVIDGKIFFGSPFDGLFYRDGTPEWMKVAPGGYFAIYEANGWYYMGSAQQPLQRSQDLMTWVPLAKTPSTVSEGIVSDGQRIFAGARAYVQFMASDVKDGQTWAMVPPPPVKDGVKAMAYDAVNHLLYSVNLASGLWRMVTH